MPVISESLIPTINPGSLLSRLVDDNSISIRWLTSKDPNYFEVLNRPHADIALRQLIIAKATDALQLTVSYLNLFPFLVQPRVVSGTSQDNLPQSWIWAMNVSLPAKWEHVRLAKIKRISGANPVTGGTGSDYSGDLRLVFTAQEEGSTAEVAVFQVDYTIESTLAFQRSRITIPTSAEESSPLPQSESETVDGFVTFRTLDVNDQANQDFFDFLDTPVSMVDADGDGEFDTPAVYHILDETDTTNYTLTGLAHGTGLLVNTAYNAIPPVESSVDNWLASFNYPFDDDAALQSSTHVSVIIPDGLFKQFSILAPAGDEPTSDISGEYFPVYVSKVVQETATTDTLSLRFSTYNVESPSTAPLEFASLTLERSMTAGQRVEILPTENLFPTHSGETNWFQGFGRGHVVLSSKWGGTSSDVDTFFDAVMAITDTPAEALFTKDASRLSSFGVQLGSEYTPTAGQAAALKGNRDGVSGYDPSATNRFVVEGDDGQGSQVDFIDDEGMSPVDGIDRYGYTGGRAHPMVKLILDSSKEFDYDTELLPRLTALYGRAPIFGDQYYDGTRVKFFNGSTWQTF